MKMAKLADLLGNARRQDMIRMSKNESVPNRGKKKHGTQMTKEEIEYLFKRLRSVKRWRMSAHAVSRITEKGIKVTYRDAVSTIHTSKIIEYHIVNLGNGKKDERVLLRGNAVVNRDSNVHFVYSLTRQEIVSSWLNRVDDKHNTLDWRDYDEKLRIKGA